MIRVVVFIRDMVIALALGWIGVTLQPSAPEEPCPLKGADAAMCTSSRTPGFSVHGAVADAGCPNS